MSDADWLSGRREDGRRMRRIVKALDESPSRREEAYREGYMHGHHDGSEDLPEIPAASWKTAHSNRP